MNRDKRDKHFEYDKEIDSLTIYHKNFSENQNIAGSLNYGDFIFDIASDGSFVSLEIDNASKVFNISPKELDNIRNAGIKTVVKGNAIFLVYAISLDKKEIENALMIPKDKIMLAQTI